MVSPLQIPSLRSLQDPQCPFLGNKGQSPQDRATEPAELVLGDLGGKQKPLSSFSLESSGKVLCRNRPWDPDGRLQCFLFHPGSSEMASLLTAVTEVPAGPLSSLRVSMHHTRTAGPSLVAPGTSLKAARKSIHVCLGVRFS